jgi:hypothetical protein
MPRPDHIAAGDYVDQVFNHVNVAAAPGRTRRGRVYKVERSTAVVVFDDDRGRHARKRVPLNQLRVVESATSVRSAPVVTDDAPQPTAAAGRPAVADCPPSTVHSPTAESELGPEPVLELAAEIAALREMARSLIIRAEERVKAAREELAALDVERLALAEELQTAERALGVVRRFSEAP